MRPPWIVGCLTLALAAEASAQTPPPTSPPPTSPPASALPPTSPPHTASWLVPALHGVGLLLGQRVAESVLWTHAFSLEDGDRNVGHLRVAFTEAPAFDPHRSFFEWDGDRWEINLLGHGLMGSELYLRARQCEHGVAASLAFAAASTVVWEYGVEVWNSRPSANDLLWTPLGGALLGELRYFTWGMAASLPRGARAVVRALVDPFGELERALGTPC
jgi:hypothetical protein